MATTKKPTSPAAAAREPNAPRKNYVVVGGDDATANERALASMITSPDMAACRVIRGAEAKSGLDPLIDTPRLMETLREQALAVNRNDLAQVEAMLMNQATALQTLFARLAERGMGCDNTTPFELNMRMALRAQSQCRATLETLASIKNPPVVIAKQANVTTGPQQVNNGIPSRTREIESEQTKLLEAEHGQRLDTRAASATSAADQELAPVGAIDGAKDGRG